MGSYGKNIVSARVGQGLNYALEDAERTRRARNQERRADEAHAMRMQEGQMRLDAAQAEQAHAAFSQQMDQAIGQLVATQGRDFQAFEQAYNAGYPDGHEMRVVPQADGKFVLDFGAAGKSQPMELDQLVGLGTTMKNPQLYYEEMQARQQRKQEQAATIATEDRAEKRKIAGEERADKRKIAGEERAHRYRLTEKQTPSAPAIPTPKFEVDDSGRQNIVTRDGVYRLPNPEGSTFKDDRTGGKPPATVQEIEYFMEHLPPMEGETPAQRFVRAAAARAEQLGKTTSPQEAVREFEKTITAKLLDSEFGRLPPEQQTQVKGLIRGLVKEFAQRYGGGAPAAGGAAVDDPLGIL